MLAEVNRTAGGSGRQRLSSPEAGVVVPRSAAVLVGDMSGPDVFSVACWLKRRFGEYCAGAAWLWAAYWRGARMRLCSS